MNAHIGKALTWDALYQVLDNWVFRILAAMTLIPILITFMIGFREDEIVLLFGLKSWGYEELLNFFGQGIGGASSIIDHQGFLIEVFLGIVFQYLAGALGLLFCIAATAFFVPRMLEKGAAEVLFHKPVSRWTLWLSRYFAGLLFIGLVSAIMVGGMYLGLLLVSGYHDPGILLASLSLTYLFGLIYSFSMLVGVVTRSSVAAILLTTLFFFFNGCIHAIWMAKEMGWNQDLEVEKPPTPTEPSAAGTAPETQSGAPADDGGAPRFTLEEKTEDTEEEDSTLGRLLIVTLDTLHYVLPKTGDSDIIATKLRRRIDPPLYRDHDSHVAVYDRPKGMEQVEPAALALDPTLRERLGEARLAFAVDDPELPQAKVVFWRRTAAESESKIASRTRIRRETTSQAAGAWEELLAQRAGVRDVARDPLRFGSNAKGVQASGTSVRWTEETADGVRSRTAIFFKGTDTEWIYTLWIDTPGEVSDEAYERLFQRIDRSLGVDANPMNEASWYESKLGLRSPLRYNVLFSVGSSLAFAALMLFIGWLKLRRIEF